MSVRTPVKGIVYRYSVKFPRTLDAPRPDWDAEVADKMNAIPGMLTWIAYDPTNAWMLDERRVEARSQVIHAEIAAPSEAVATERREAFMDLICELRDQVDQGAKVVVSRWRIDAEEISP